MWKFATVLVVLLSVGSTLIAAAIVSHQNLSWRHYLNLEGRLQPAQAPVTYEITMVVEQVNRKVFPYSVVPGGAETLDAAKRAMSDPAVKAQYANLDFGSLKQVKLTRSLEGYVSYRFGEEIYWTSRPVTLRPGEIVFTDSIHLVRGRGLNCFSAHPTLPTRVNEPTEKELDTPVEMPAVVYSFSKLPIEAPQLPPPLEELTPAAPVLPSAAPNIPAGSIEFSIIPPIHGHRVRGGP
jgi:hypothetical protein